MYKCILEKPVAFALRGQVAAKSQKDILETALMLQKTQANALSIIISEEKI